jgi:hypothetical protein
MQGFWDGDSKLVHPAIFHRESTGKFAATGSRLAVSSATHSRISRFPSVASGRAERLTAVYVILHTDAGYSWQLFSADKRLLAVSPSTYKTLDECRDAIQQTRQVCDAKVNIDPVSDG